MTRYIIGFLIGLSVYCFSYSAFGQDTGESQRWKVIPWDEATEEQRRASIEDSIDRQCSSKNLIKSFIVKKQEGVEKAFGVVQFIAVCGADSINQIIKTMVCSGELDMDELIWISPEIDIDVEFINSLKENIVCP